MTLQQLNELCNKNNIPEDVKLLSDSGWECCETEMDGVWYAESINTIVFTQGYEETSYQSKGWSDGLAKGISFVRLMRGII